MSVDFWIVFQWRRDADLNFVVENIVGSEADFVIIAPKTHLYRFILTTLNDSIVISHWWLRLKPTSTSFPVSTRSPAHNHVLWLSGEKWFPPRFLAECGKSPLNQGSFVVLYFVLFNFSGLYLVTVACHLICHFKLSAVHRVKIIQREWHCIA